MAKAEIVTRKRGRPSKEESTAIATEKAILEYRLKVAMLLPTAVDTLKGLLSSGSEKVKEGTAKFLINEAKEVFNIYVAEDNQDSEAGGTVSANSQTHAGSSDEFKNIMPLTTEIREYKMAEGED
ncbi:hypothetical protein [Salmonella phage SSBI34]|nr:hypothetical protein [Salmonella phage SSBI34]